MRPPPPLSHLLYYPVTAHVGAAALSLSLAKFGGVDLSFLYTDYHTWPYQPWRLLTSALPHGNILHLLVNLYGLWLLGTIVEDKLGGLRTLAVYLMFAFGSSAAEFALFDGGIGLSGVLFGVFGMLWVLSKRDPRFAGVIDYQATATIVFWFFLCIVLTITNVMAIGNVAHGSGALLGYLLGWAMSARTRQLRLYWWASLIAALLIFTAASWWARPYINLSLYPALELYNAGTEALEKGRPEESVELLRQSVRYNSKSPDTWHNLGVAYYKVGRHDEMRQAWERERELRSRQLEP